MILILLLSLLITPSIEAINDICVDFPEDGTKNFAHRNYNNTTEVITFMDLWNPPHFFSLSNKICGPFAKIIVEVSKRYGYSIRKIPYPEDKSKLFEILLSDKPPVMLFPVTPSLYEKGLELGLGGMGVLSKPLGIKSDGHVVTKIRPGRRNVFEFILGFEIPVWIGLLLTIPFIPLALALVKKTLSSYITDLWNYTYTILSQTIPRIPTSSTQRFIITLWLLSCTVLLAGYAGVIRGFFIKGVPDEVVDSWEDLHNRKDLKIVTMEGSVIEEFADKECDTNEMAADFKSRMEIKLKLGDNYRDLSKLMFEHDNYAVSLYDYYMNECYDWLPEGRNRADCEKLHVSKHGGVTVPYFLILSYRMSAEARENFNKIISRSIDSGLYEKWLTESINMRRLYQPEYDQSDKPKLDSEVIHLESISGVFIIFSIGITISIVVFIMEVVYHSS